MAIYQVGDKRQLTGFRAVLGGPGKLYEDEIEELVWNNTEELTGEGLFPVARQPTVPGGGIPDIVALDRQARVVVIEVKRDIERNHSPNALSTRGGRETPVSTSCRGSTTAVRTSSSRIGGSSRTARV